MYFVGNFRHLPNREAVEYLANDVLPQLDPELLARHPLTVVGNWLDRVQLDLDPDTPGLRLVGWVPTMAPYVERSRLAAVPLLHGAGVKRKVIQAMMAGTPVVTTPVGAEGLDLVQGEHALIARDATDLAAGITRLLTDDDLWHRMAAAGADHADRRHGVDLVEQRFAEILEQVMTPRRHDAGPTRRRRPTVRRSASGSSGSAVPAMRCSSCAAPTTACSTRARIPCWPFPQSRDDADRPGPDPVDGTSAVHHLEAQRTAARATSCSRVRRTRGATATRSWSSTSRPSTNGCTRTSTSSSATSRRTTRTAHASTPSRTRACSCIGTYAAHRTGPPPVLVTELASSCTLDGRAALAAGLRAAYRDTADDADYVVHVRDDVILPRGSSTRSIATQVDPRRRPPPARAHRGPGRRPARHRTPLRGGRP